MRDAKITDFVETTPGSYRLTYEVRGKKGSVSYTLAEDGSAKFVFVDTRGNTTNETYSPQRRGPGGTTGGRRHVATTIRAPKRASVLRRETSSRGPTNSARDDSSKPHSDLPKLAVTSSSVDAKGFISVDCTCDGASQSPAVEWKDAPQGTKSFALSLWHIAPDQEKSYWVVYNIPADVTKLAKNARDVGKLGLNDKRRAEYDPMCSKGPGVKEYHITVYALSAEPKLSPDKATRANLLEAIRDITLAEGTLDFQYERKK